MSLPEFNPNAPMTTLNLRPQTFRMDRATLEEQFRLTKAHVALGNEQIARQRELIRLLEQAGKDAAAANQLLRHLEKLQEVFVAEAWKLSVQLASIPE
jgi:hypothetical protein